MKKTIHTKYYDNYYTSLMNYKNYNHKYEDKNFYDEVSIYESIAEKRSSYYKYNDGLTPKEADDLFNLALEVEKNYKEKGLEKLLSCSYHWLKGINKDNYNEIWKKDLQETLDLEQRKKRNRKERKHRRKMK